MRAVRRPSALIDSRRRHDRLLWGGLGLVVAAAAVAVRVWTYRSVLGTTNADESVVGLMVRRALDGELTAFYWGQAYGGTQEVLLTVPVFLVTGTSLLGLRLVVFLLSAVAAYLVWRVGRRTIGSPAAEVATGVFALWPAVSVWFLTRQQGFYASNVVYCALLLLLALRLVERPDRRRVALFAFVLGLAFWQTAQIIPVAVGMLAWTIWSRPRLLRELWVAVPLFVLGALPFFAWNALNGWESFSSHGQTDYVGSLRLFFPTMVAMTIGLRTPFSTEPLVPTLLLYPLYLAIAAAFAYGAYRSRGRPVSLLYTVAATFPFVYALSPQTAVLNPRFIVVLAPVLALLFAQLATTYRRAVAVLAAAFVLSTVSLVRMDGWFRELTGVTPANVYGPRGIVEVVPRDLDPLVAELDRLDLDRVFADYWLAYRLTFDTRERIIAAESSLAELEEVGGRVVPVTHPHVRYRPYEREVRAARAGYVLYRDLVSSVPVAAELERRGFARHEVDGYVIYVPPR